MNPRRGTATPCGVDCEKPRVTSSSSPNRTAPSSAATCSSSSAYADDFDMVCGTRTTRELVWEQANMGWFLRVGNLIVAKMIQVLYDGPSLTDCGCTLRLTHRRALTAILDDLTVGGSHFLPEMVILGLRRGLKIIEVPVNYRGRVGESKITGTLRGTLRTGFRMIGLILRFRLS